MLPVFLQTDVLETEYFDCLSALYGYVIDGVHHTAKERHADPRVFDTTIAAVTLAWIGFCIHDACHVLKDDLHTAHPLVRFQGGEYRPVQQRAWEFLCEYRDSVEFYTRRDMTALQPYVQSVYLLRTNRSMQLNPTAIRAAICRNIPQKEKHVTYDSVYWSGVFFRAFVFERERGDIKYPKRGDATERKNFVEITRALLGEHDTEKEYDLYSRYRQFCAYKRHFHCR